MVTSNVGSRRTLIVAAAIALAVLVAASGCQPGRGGTGSESIPAFDHVFMILMENKDYQEVIGSPDAPFINKLAREYALAGSYYGIRHPSLPNYLALISGSTQGMTYDCPDCSFDSPNLADQIEASRKSWRAYAEDLPEPCFNGASAGTIPATGRPLYVRKHNPWMYFSRIAGNPARCASVVPLSRLQSDLANNRLPDLTYIVPNMLHDMHDGSVRDGDAWLADNVPAIIASPAWKENGVLFLLWDEGNGDEGCCGVNGGRTIAIVAASAGKTGFVSKAQYTHYSVLRTIEDGWKLGLLGEAGARETQPMADFFK